MQTSKDPKATHSSANMADTHKLAHKISLHYPKSHTMHSANRPPLLKAHSKVIQTNNLSPKRNRYLELSLLHPTNSLPITRRIPNSVMFTIATTTSNMGYSRAPRVSKTGLYLSKGHTVATMVLKQRTRPSSHKVLHNQLSHVTRLLEKAKLVVILLQTQPFKVSNQELLKAPHPSQVTSSNPKLETTRMDIRITPARTTLHT
jgi:hypothetical protein